MSAANPTPAAPRTAAELAELDRVESRIDIDAPAERVWELVARPGWYINEGTVDDGPELLGRDGDITLVRHPVHGEFRFRTVSLERPRYAAFRWIGPAAEAAAGDGEPVGTLVEFWIDERDGGVTLRVAESGFSTLSDDPAVWLKERDANDHGWGVELPAAKTYLEAPRP